MILSALVLALTAATATAANPAALDPAFGTGGRVQQTFDEPELSHRLNDIHVLPGGRILAVGSGGYSDAGESTTAIVARFNADGTLDSSFAADGRFEFASPDAYTYGEVVAADREGRILFAASIYDSHSFGRPTLVVARLQGDGELDPSFSKDGVAEIDFQGGRITSLAAYPNGKVVAAGSGRPGPFDQFRFAVARLKENGEPDLGFSENGRQMPDVEISDPDESVEDVALGRNGEVLLAGQSGDSNGTAGAAVRLHFNGSLDKSFSGDGVASFGGAQITSAEGVLIHRDGRIVFAARSGDEFAALRLTHRGGWDRTFSGDGRTTIRFSGSYVYASAEDIVRRRGGGYVLGGTRSRYGANLFAFVALHPNGSRDAGFSGDGRALVRAEKDLGSWPVAIGRDRRGRIVAGGTTQEALPPHEFALIRLLGDTARPRPAAQRG